MKLMPSNMPSTMSEMRGQPETMMTARMMLAIPESSMPTQPGDGRASRAKNNSVAPWNMNMMPTMSVSVTAPARGLNSRNTPPAAESRPNRLAAKNGPVPWIQKELTKMAMPEMSSTQPTSSVAAKVLNSGKAMAATPSTTSTSPSQNSLGEAWRSLS